MLPIVCCGISAQGAAGVGSVHSIAHVDSGVNTETPPSHGAALPTFSAFKKGAGLARQDPVFHLLSFPQRNAKGAVQLYEQPFFTVGNKSVYLRRVDGRNLEDKDEYISIYIDDKELGRVFFWGSYGGRFGYPFEEIEEAPEQLIVDEMRQTATYRKPYLAKNGETAVFSFTLRSLGDSQLEVYWNVDSTGVVSEPIGVAPWFLIDEMYRKKQLYFGDEAIDVASHQILTEGKVVQKVSGDFRLSSEDPASAYSLMLGGINGQITQTFFKDDRYEFMFRGQSRPEGRLTIDLGEAKLRPKDAPPLVAGHDFWKIDALHVPLSPVKNLWPNPSFEQGLRYWNWTGGGARYTPGEGPRYHIAKEGRFGLNALGIREEQHSSAALQSLPVALESGESYTLSFYAKADVACPLTVALASASQGGKFRGKYGVLFGDSGSAEATFKLTTEWQRFSRTFVADGAGLTLVVRGSRNSFIDGIQLEKGTEATEFVADPLDGFLVTNDADNAIQKGSEVGAAFRFTGEPATRGVVRVTVSNPYRETLYQEALNVNLPESGVQTVPLSFDSKVLGEGVFLVRADFSVDGFDSYTDYYRFSIMEPLSNTHATKDIFGTLTNFMARIGRGDDLGEKFRDWGFGSTSWGVSIDQIEEGVLPSMERRYGISNFFTSTIPRGTEVGDILDGYKKWESVTQELEQLIEAAAYEKVKRYDPGQYDTWNFGNEEESASLPGSGQFDEYFKVQSAAARGVKRANPNALYSPTNGTSGYSRLRGYKAIEGYLAAAQRHGFKYDAISVHPYWDIDKGSLSDHDLDEETARLIEQMQRYGYGEDTPIFFTEAFNIPAIYFPAWGANNWADQYQCGKLSYDFGNRELIHAASAARFWIIALKYWPQVRSTNIWFRQPYVDYHLSPLIISKAVNTLGLRFFDVDYYADIKPTAGIRGYSFERADGKAIAAIWCVDKDVENGLKVGPVMDVSFDQEVSYIDLMGNPRSAQPDLHGVVHIPLSPVPLLIEADDVKGLTASLLAAQTSETAPNVSISVSPALDGSIHAEIKNLTGRDQVGVLTVEDVAHAYSLQAEQGQSVTIVEGEGEVEFGKMYRWNGQLKVQAEDGDQVEAPWAMDYFYVPKTSGMPDWSKVPAIDMDNRFVFQNVDGGLPIGDQSARLRMAWDESNLYLRVEVKDDVFFFEPELWAEPIDRETRFSDGFLEVYLDTAADARDNIYQTYDNNDYAYAFSVNREGASGPGVVNRFRAVNHQLAQGLDMPTQAEAAERIGCDFERTDSGYNYTITLGQRYLEPLMLEKGAIAGFGLTIHDRDSDGESGTAKGLSLATESGAVCDSSPHLWPLMILTE